MTLAADASSQTSDEPKYGRFSRRLQGLMIDSIVMSILLAVALFVAVSLQSDNVGRILGFSVVAIFLLYEPVLVSLTGSTIGHLATNLRVVDNRTGKNVNFPKAVVRAVIKGVLGLYSFFTMAFTRRHQALHDVLTNSTVQIRDQTRARPHQYSLARAVPADRSTPSALRRIAVIAAYGIAVTCIIFIPIDLINAAYPIFSDDCLDHDICSVRDNIILDGLLAFCFIAVVLIAILGWRGKLWGARSRPDVS
jgi:uncharacterized RDD family membrane protein YckC